jgi:hypothetical protein
MSGTAHRVLVAGTAGGVGTTTVTALLFSRLRDNSTGAPPLLDHTAGDLGARLPDGDEVRQLSEQLLLHDLGPHALDAGVAGLADPSTVLVLVSAATPVGCLLARGVVEAVHRSSGATNTARTVVLLSGAFGRHRIRRQVRGLATAAAPAGLVLLPADPALAVGGRIPLTRLSRSTDRAVDVLLDLVVGGRRAQPPTEVETRGSVG